MYSSPRFVSSPYLTALLKALPFNGFVIMGILTLGVDRLSNDTTISIECTALFCKELSNRESLDKNMNKKKVRDL